MVKLMVEIKVRVRVRVRVRYCKNHSEGSHITV
jgi:hypothetical protein